ncbi:MAG: hypothetical protein MZV70_27310 [Desulfobacterales bacterium]|nr:hypothetical protein [Desulfobacterales bacterium]
MVKEGKFRDDLYYRLNIVAINLPPLRTRRQDIPQLIDYLLAKINLDLHKKIIGVSDEMMEIVHELLLAGQYPRTGESAGAGLCCGQRPGSGRR